MNQYIQNLFRILSESHHLQSLRVDSVFDHRGLPRHAYTSIFRFSGLPADPGVLDESVLDYHGSLECARVMLRTDLGREAAKGREGRDVGRELGVLLQNNARRRARARSSFPDFPLCARDLDRVMLSSLGRPGEEEGAAYLFETFRPINNLDTAYAICNASSIVW